MKRLILVLALVGVFTGNATHADNARKILEVAGIKGGLLVHVGCGDGKLTAAMRLSDSFIVQGLDADVTKARENIRTAKVYGPVTAETWAGGRLPYADNVVNALLIRDARCNVSQAEIQRVLAPHGMAVFLDPETRVLYRQPWPKEMDEWTHWFHGPDNTNVSRDQLVGPPRKLQWTAGPFWGRHHALPNTVSVVVTAGGRLFYVVDESPTSVLAGVPDRWSLVACDAFSGVELWRRPMNTWGRSAWGKEFYTDPAKQLRHFWKLPADAKRRMVADGDRLLMSLGYAEPVSVLDGATGRTMHTFAGSENCDMVLRSGKLVYIVGGGGKDAPSIAAYDAQTFRPVWKRDKARSTSVTDCAIRDGLLALMDRNSLVAIDAASGTELWRSQNAKASANEKFVQAVLAESALLVVDDKDNLLAFSTKNGAFQWTYPLKRLVHRNLDEASGSHLQLYVVGNTAWASTGSTSFSAINLETGRPERTIDATPVLTSPHHHRCYTDRATEKFAILGKENVEFVGFQQPDQQVCNWVRGTCQFGVLPANGMLYVPPSACTCYMNIMLRGFNALTSGHDSLPTNFEPLLERGPAFGTTETAAPDAADDWPTYRHDAARSGTTKEKAPTSLAPNWRAMVGGRLTPPVVAGSNMIVAASDRHEVHCLDAASGRSIWAHVVGGRIDTPPTIAGPRVLFGCRDGWVYCLRVADGALVWRLRAAPAERQIVADGQLESSWPLHGSVLLHNGVAYVAAGRTTRLDGGIRLLAVDPATGRVLHKVVLDTPERTTPLKDNRDPEERTGFASDILVADGKDFWMRTGKFTPQLQVESVGFRGGTGGGGMSPNGGVTALPHLTAVSGFLDDRYFDRVYWGYEGVFGQMLVVSDKMVYGVRAFDHTGFSLSYKPGSGYILFGETHEGRKAKNPLPVKLRDSQEDSSSAAEKAASTEDQMARPHPLPSNLWTQRCNLRVRAMVLADQTLVIAGTPDTVDPKDPYATFAGRGPAKLRWVAAANGQTLGELDLDSSPVWDGLVVAKGRVYLSTSDGQIRCFDGGSN